MGRLTAWRTGSEKHRRHPCRIPRHICPTSPRHWSQPRLQDITDAKKRPARIHAKPTLPSEPQGRSHSGTCPNALLRHHNLHCRSAGMLAPYLLKKAKRAPPTAS